MDVLTSVLSAMKLSGSVFLEAEFSSPWCVTSQMSAEDCATFFPVPAHVISYHYVVSGSFLCGVGSDPPFEVGEGHILMMPRNDLHRIGSRLEGEAISSRELICPPEEGGLSTIRYGGGGEVTRMFCGYLGTVAPINAFLMSLPSALVIDTKADAAGQWMASSIRFASTEAARSPELVGRLAELLFGEAVRHYIRSLPADQTGWLAGLRDPYVGRALALLHARYGEPWTTDALAKEVALSRSAFADRFASLIGEPPMRYLGRHRMNVAANRLQDAKENACNIAYEVGFNSEAAFSRAFKKEFGVPPGAWQRERCH